MVELTHRERLGIFCDPIIFFARKNHKLAIKESMLLQTSQAFNAQLGHYLDVAHLKPDKVFMERGKESISNWTAVGKDVSPVFLYRPCCLDSFPWEMSLSGLGKQMRRNNHHTAMIDRKSVV